MGIEFKSFGFKLDASNRDEALEQRIIKGYGSTFENPENADSYGDVVLPGAYDETIANDFPAGRIKIFGMHWQPIGMPTKLMVDAKGLYIEGRLSKTTAGDEALQLALDGVLNEMSIGFEAKDYDFIEFNGKTIRRLKRVKLYEVSLVPWGANPYAKVTEAIKGFSLGLERELREGRVLSKSNFELLLKARDYVNTVISTASPNDDDVKADAPPAKAEQPESAKEEPVYDEAIIAAIVEGIEQFKALLTA